MTKVQSSSAPELLARELRENFKRVSERIERACARAGRKTSEVQLLPVSKGQNVEKIVAALSVPAFPRCLGENYADELCKKAQSLQARSFEGEKVEWHFIGRLQSRRIVDVAAVASVIQSVSREKEIALLAKVTASRLYEKKSAEQGQLIAQQKLFIQVNVSGEGQKNGCSESELEGLLQSCEKARLNCAGLMCLPGSLEASDEKTLRGEFSKLRELRNRFLPTGLLSMGMSGDFEWAIEEGSNLVRVGTALFGER